MPALKSRTDLAQAVEKRLRELAKLIRLPNIASKARECLREDSNVEIPEDRELLLKILPMWADEKNISLERAAIDISIKTKLIGDVEHGWLLQAIGEGEATSRVVPVWDSGRGELYYRGELVRRVPGIGVNIRRVLNAFEEEHWPSRIDDPLPGGKNSRRLRETVRSLNKKLLKLRFFSDCSAMGILFQEASDLPRTSRA